MVRYSRVIRLPKGVHEKVVTMGIVRSMLQRDLGRDPTLDEIATHHKVRLNPDKAATYSKAAEPVRSLDLRLTARGGSDDSTAVELGHLVEDRTGLRPEEEVERSILQDELQELLAGLPDLEREVITLRFGLRGAGHAHSYEEVIAALADPLSGLLHPEVPTKALIKRIETRAFYKLRRPSTIAKALHLRDAMYGEADKGYGGYYHSQGAA